MSRVELNQAAKGRGIKHYYIMTAAQLRQLLKMEELPLALRIEKMTIHELRDEAKRRGLRGFWTLRRERLVELLFQAPADENQKNEGDADKHNEPQQHDPKEVGV